MSLTRPNLTSRSVGRWHAPSPAQLTIMNTLQVRRGVGFNDLCTVINRTSRAATSRGTLTSPSDCPVIDSTLLSDWRLLPQAWRLDQFTALSVASGCLNLLWLTMIYLTLLRFTVIYAEMAHLAQRHICVDHDK